MAKKEVKLIEEVLKVKNELSEKHMNEIKDQLKIIVGLKNEQRSLKETIVKLSIDSNELKTMKKHNNYQSLYDGQQELINGKGNSASDH
jgi:hypothetical protein